MLMLWIYERNSLHCISKSCSINIISFKSLLLNKLNKCNCCYLKQHTDRIVFFKKICNLKILSRIRFHHRQLNSLVQIRKPRICNRVTSTNWINRFCIRGNIILLKWILAKRWRLIRKLLNFKSEWIHKCWRSSGYI